jgi:hypothetical protein
MGETQVSIGDAIGNVEVLDEIVLSGTCDSVTTLDTAYVQTHNRASKRRQYRCSIG